MERKKQKNGIAISNYALDKQYENISSVIGLNILIFICTLLASFFEIKLILCSLFMLFVLFYYIIGLFYNRTKYYILNQKEIIKEKKKLDNIYK